MSFCCYGCGNESKFVFKNKKECCSRLPIQCPEIKKRISEKNKTNQLGNKNGMFGKTAYNHGKTLEELHGNEEAIRIREQRSESIKNRIVNGFNTQNCNKYFRGFAPFYKTGELIRFDSSYELSTIKILDTERDDILYVTRFPFFILYEHKKTIRHYFPDFLVVYKNNERSLLEVKAKYKINYPKEIAKRKAAIKFCECYDFKYVIWTEDILKEYPIFISIQEYIHKKKRGELKKLCHIF